MISIKNRYTGAVLLTVDAETLVRADLSSANLTGANLNGADLSGAYLTDLTVPKVSHLDVEMIKAIEAPGHALNMNAWHSCDTTHCRAGWAITLAGEEGKRLEEAVGPAAAGALIYHASTGMVPDFYASNEDAMKDIKKCAKVEGAE